MQVNDSLPLGDLTDAERLKLLAIVSHWTRFSQTRDCPTSNCSYEQR